MTDTTIVNEEEVITPEPTEEVTEVETPVEEPGSKTESVLLLESLQEERRKRREAEAALEAAKSTEYLPEDEVRQQLAAIQARLDSKIETDQLQELQAKYPALKDKLAEFNDYRDDPENKGMSVSAAARAFLAERDLLVTPAPRKGLEEGRTQRAPVKTGRTEADVTELRNTNYRQYMKELKAGTLWN